MYLHLKRWSSSEVIQILPSQSPTTLPSTLVNSIASHLKTYPHSSLSVVTPEHKILASSNAQERQNSATTSPLATSQSITTNTDVSIGSLSSQTTATSFKSPSPNSLSTSSTQGVISNRQCTTDGKLHPLVAGETFLFCDVCAVTQASADFSHLACRHLFCKGCWELHFECQILQGLSTSKFCNCTVNIYIYIFFPCTT